MRKRPHREYVCTPKKPFGAVVFGILHAEMRSQEIGYQAIRKKEIEEYALKKAREESGTETTVRHLRPEGRAPNEKTWSYFRGLWVDAY